MALRKELLARAARWYHSKYRGCPTIYKLHDLLRATEVAFDEQLTKAGIEALRHAG